MLYVFCFTIHFVQKVRWVFFASVFSELQFYRLMRRFAFDCKQLFLVFDVQVLWISVILVHS